MEGQSACDFHKYDSAELFDIDRRNRQESLEGNIKIILSSDHLFFVSYTTYR